MTMNKTHTPQDPVAVYDIMREAATRLMSLYAQRITVGGDDDPAAVEIRNIRAQARAVDTHDMDAQLAATAEFNERYTALRAS